MSLYEHVFLVRQDVSQQLVDELVEQFKGIIETAGGTVAKVESWGVKSLAYRIRKNRKAHFTLMNINAPSAAVVEMERMMGINEDVLRFITIKVEEHEEGPSAMLQKRDRDDRDREGREGRPPRRDDRDREGREGRPPRRRDDDAEFAVVAEEV